MIECQQLTKTFTRRSPMKTPLRALDGVSFTAEAGQITALLGPNGAGKTTLLRILAGLERADHGTVQIHGLPTQQQHGRLSYLNEACGLYPRLTVLENIRYFGALYGVTPERCVQRLQVLDTHLQVSGLYAKRAGECSLGERMRVALARALLHDPSILVLDEPTNGLDLASVRRLRRYLRYLVSDAGGRKCILFSTHQMHEVEKMADHVVIIAQGKVMCTGSVQDLMTHTATTQFEDAFATLVFPEE